MLYTSTHFASAAAAGTDWRDISKKVLEALETVHTPDAGFNIGFLYMTDLLTEDADSILGLFKSVTGIENWIGCCGLGVAACGESFVDRPAISAMIGRLDPGQFHTFFATSTEQDQIKKEMKNWLKASPPMLTVLHGNAITEAAPDYAIGLISERLGGFTVGGMTSARHRHVHYATKLRSDGFSGVSFSENIPVATAMSQGCVPISSQMTITKADGHVIFELDGRKPFDVFTDTLKSMAEKKTGLNPDEIIIENHDGQGESLHIPQEFKDLFKGEVHVALPVPGSDTQDYMVRNIVGIDPDEGVMAISHKVSIGDRILFVHRDDETFRTDLNQTLVALRQRVAGGDGDFKPKAALYFSCISRAMTPFTEEGGNELELVRRIIGDVPLAGFYAAGEISGGRFYGQTGVLVLFL